MRRSVPLIAALIAASTALADGVSTPSVPRGHHGIGVDVFYPSGSVGYGPFLGDMVPGASAWGGLRAYSAVYAAANGKAVSLRRAKDNVTCDFDFVATGRLGTSDASCSLGGGLSLATFATQDATASCTIAGATATCTGGSSLPHAGSTITGAGLTQPCFAAAAGSGTAASFTIALAGLTGSSFCGAIGVAEMMTFTYGLYATILYDQTGNGFNITEASSAKQPLLLPSCSNSLPCMWYNIAVATNMTVSVTALKPYTVGQTIYNYGTANSLVASYSSGFHIYVNLAGAANGQFDCGSALINPLSNNAWHSVLGICNGSLGSFTVDNSTVAGNSGTVSNNALNIGINSTANNFTGFMTEIGLWPFAFSSAQQAALCNNQWTVGLGSVSPPC
jgi:hypothetical protein